MILKMEPKYSQIFDKNIIKSLKEFCELNKIKDIDEFIKKCFDLGFNIEKYGLLGKNGEIKEKIVEVPVEPKPKPKVPNSWTFTPKTNLPVDNDDKDVDSKYYIKKPKS